MLCFCVLVGAICLLPMLHRAKSLSGTDYLVRHEVSLWPKGLNFDAYATVLKDPKYIRAFFWTVFLTVVCTLLSLTMTVLCAYPLIFKQLKGRGFINILITITMFFNAGTIPNYLLMQKLGLLNNPLVLIIQLPVGVQHDSVMRSFFYGIRRAAESAGLTARPTSRFCEIYVPCPPLSWPPWSGSTPWAVERLLRCPDDMKDANFYPLQLLLYNVDQQHQLRGSGHPGGFSSHGPVRLPESGNRHVLHHSHPVHLPLAAEVFHPWRDHGCREGITESTDSIFSTYPKLKEETQWQRNW